MQYTAASTEGDEFSLAMLSIDFCSCDRGWSIAQQPGSPSGECWFCNAQPAELTWVHHRGGKQKAYWWLFPSFPVASAVDESEFQGPELQVFGNQGHSLGSLLQFVIKF